MEPAVQDALEELGMRGMTEQPQSPTSRFFYTFLGDSLPLQNKSVFVTAAPALKDPTGTV